MRFLTSLAALSLAAMATPAFAASEGVSCMQDGYDRAVLDRIAQLNALVDIGAGNANPANGELNQIVLQAVQTCGAKHSWNQTQAFHAFVFEVGRLNEAAFRQFGPFTPQQLSAIDRELLTGDRSQLWAVMEAEAQRGMTGQPIDSSEEDNLVVGKLLGEAGLPATEKTSRDAGLLLGMMVLQRIGARDFASLK